MTSAELKTRQAGERKIAAMLIYEARFKEHEAALWLGLPRNIEEAAGNVHSALDAVLDATAAQIRASREQYGSAA
jgi:hypothetical protein